MRKNIFDYEPKKLSYDLAICSLYANPLTVGHTDYIKAASDLAKKVCVIVNSDHQVRLKGSCPFMSENDRLEIVQALWCVDHAFIAVDQDDTVARSIEVIAQLYLDKKVAFCNGGDRQIGNHSKSEELTCDEYLIDAVYNVGGDYKRESSSWLIAQGAGWVYNKKVAENWLVEGSCDRQQDLVLDLREFPDEKTTDMIYERIPDCLISQTNGVPQLTVSCLLVPDGNKDEYGMYGNKKDLS